MLRLNSIVKTYSTGAFTQNALNGVSLSFRESEFVAILGPSGSGKTTLLNLIGGLDRYTSGDLIINGVSTKEYRDADWDCYRNNSIGFVFQSYNLIPHQTVLANVEMALTLAGVSRRERRQRAASVLKKVGLGEHLHKKPNQLSGGQMQRVAIARALVNDPDILLADEPTGALDTETSVQVMDLLKEVARDRLVVMVTHNPELAQQYATRIVRLRDGRIIDDSDPLVLEQTEEPRHRNLGKASMSLKTALSLSFNNLRTKKARTLLTAFAGSIGIIGIALILSLSTGVNTYIDDTQRATMTSYPISIEARTVDMTSIITSARSNAEKTLEDAEHPLDGVYSNPTDLKMISAVSTSITENNLTEFKSYLDDPESEIWEYVGENGIVYTYDVSFDVYTHDPDGKLVNTNGSSLYGANRGMQASGAAMMSMMVGTSGNANFSQLLPGQETLVSPSVQEEYELLYGHWPEHYDELVLMLDRNHEIPATTLYQLGILPAAEYETVIKALEQDENPELESVSWTYEEICAQELYLIPACDTYLEQKDGTFRWVEEEESELEALLDSAISLKLAGVVRPAEDQRMLSYTSAIGYTSALTDEIIRRTEESPVVRAQKADDQRNVLSGMQFEPADDEQKLEDVRTWLDSLGTTEKAALCRELLAARPDMAAQMEQADEPQLAAALDGFLADAGEETLLALYDSHVSPGSYEDNLSAFGVVSYDAPASINIYSDAFEDKDEIARCIDDYNQGREEEDQITYTDYVGLLMSSVTTIVDVVSYVLIAFVAVSLVVSSIMIGIITYISVLERTKEIGILRAIGASRRNISQVFNAETLIIGLCSGLMGVGVSALLLIPGNALIHRLTGTTEVNAILPLESAAILVVLSVVLTLIGGLIPAKKAARKDPVTALRTE